LKIKINYLLLSPNCLFSLRLQILKEVGLKMTVCWDAAPCSLHKFTDVSQVLASSIAALMMEAASTLKSR
jgi:hypothetical protein